MILAFKISFCQIKVKTYENVLKNTKENKERSNVGGREKKNLEREMTAEIESNDSYSKRYKWMKKLPICERRNTHQNNIELLGCLEKKKNHTYFHNSERVTLPHLNAIAIFDQSRDKFKNSLSTWKCLTSINNSNSLRKDKYAQFL